MGIRQQQIPRRGSEWKVTPGSIIKGPGKRDGMEGQNLPKRVLGRRELAAGAQAPEAAGLGG